MPEPASKTFIAVRANEYAMRSTNPNIPYSARELAADAAACEAAGASIFHFHARDPDTGAPAWDVDSYAAAMAALRASTNMVLMPTLGASTVPDPHQRISHIIELSKVPATRPDLVPIDMGSFNIDPYDPKTKSFGNEDITYVTPVAALRFLLTTCDEIGVKPAAVMWNVGSVRATEAFLDMGVLQSPLYAELTLSDTLLTTHPPSRAGLEAYTTFLPKDAHWSALRYGGDVLALTNDIVELGGSISVGLGDDEHTDMGTPTNAELVALAAKQIRAAGSEVATVEEVRTLLQLRPTAGSGYRP